MKRRDFVKNVSLASVATPFMLNGLNFQTITKQLFETPKSTEDRVLIIIRLSGGNDGLNTVIPLDQYDNLVIQRPNIILPENSILNLNTNIGFHPVMTGMKNMFNNGKLSIIQNVGYPEQNRSHFRSMDIWDSGLITANASTGWVGRNFDALYPNFPTDYPNSTYTDPFAISMGYQVAANCQGLMGNFSHTVEDPTAAYSVTSSNVVNDGTYFGSHMEFLATIIDQTNSYGAKIQAAANAGNSLSTLYDLNNPLAVQLKNVAKMISGGLKSKVYVLNIDGFDTHDSQVVSTDVKTGKHANLMKELSDAISAFQDDLNLLGLEQRVAGMTYSEFGRQIASNASYGTDHGDAAPLFLFGSCLNSQIVGPNPVIGSQIVDQLGIPMQIDFRDVYASILKDWFHVDSTQIQTLFEHQVTFYNLLGACNVGLEENTLSKDIAILYPNPVYATSTLKFRCENEWVKIDIIDFTGKIIDSPFDSIIEPGTHSMMLDLGHLQTGEYIISIQKQSGNQSLKMIKVRN
jgi:uncharacterized protein (DUF1501 family)